MRSMKRQQHTMPTIDRNGIRPAQWWCNWLCFRKTLSYDYNDESSNYQFVRKCVQLWSTHTSNFVCVEIFARRGLWRRIPSKLQERLFAQSQSYMFMPFILHNLVSGNSNSRVYKRAKSKRKTSYINFLCARCWIFIISVNRMFFDIYVRR